MKKNLKMEIFHTISAFSLGECWLNVSKLILDQGGSSSYDGATTKEVAHVSMAIESPDPDDPTIKQLGDPEWLAWMHENFFVEKKVAELGDATSYATRLFNYDGQGRDQIQWVVQRLKSDPTSRNSSVTTFVPLTDTSYIPCISLLDFWMPDKSVELVVYAHSLDFGKKAYGNLVELASLQTIVANDLGCKRGRLIIHVKSAHIYEPEWEYMHNIVNKKFD